MEDYPDIRCVSVGMGAFLGKFVGDFDNLIYALVIFIVVDYITGVLCGIEEKNLSSIIGFKGIYQKVFIFLLVGLAHVLDANIIGGGDVIRTSVICFYLSNEGISIVENAVRIGLPVPRKLRAVLRHLRLKGEK